jgi:hypothetical protein
VIEKLRHPSLSKGLIRILIQRLRLMGEWCVAKKNSVTSQYYPMDSMGRINFDQPKS